MSNLTKDLPRKIDATSRRTRDLVAEELISKPTPLRPAPRYQMVQTILVQDAALHETPDRIERLEPEDRLVVVVGRAPRMNEPPGASASGVVGSALLVAGVRSIFGGGRGLLGDPRKVVNETIFNDYGKGASRPRSSQPMPTSFLAVRPKAGTARSVTGAQK